MSIRLPWRIIHLSLYDGYVSPENQRFIFIYLMSLTSKTKLSTQPRVKVCKHTVSGSLQLYLGKCNITWSVSANRCIACRVFAPNAEAGPWMWTAERNDNQRAVCVRCSVKVTDLSRKNLTFHNKNSQMWSIRILELLVWILATDIGSLELLWSFKNFDRHEGEL